MTVLAILALSVLGFWAMLYMIYLLLFGGTDDDDHDDWKAPSNDGG